MSKNQTSPIELLKKKNPWADNDNRIWLSSTISLMRNIEKFNFPSKLPTDKQKALIKLISDEVKKMKMLPHPTIFNAEKLAPLQKEFLTEHFLSIENFHQAHAGEAFLLDDTGRFLTTLNLDNHLHFQLMDNGGELENSWNKLVKIETALGKTLNYVYSQRFGFLTTDPSDAGTAMIATVYIQLPALMHTERIDEILDAVADDSVSITGLQGSPTEVIGDILTIKNQYTLGVSEENILSSIRHITTKLMLEENAARSQIRDTNDAEIKDRISRAYGILIHSYQIEAIEALNALSLLKLGVDIGWVAGTTISMLNELFFNCRRAHLLSAFNEEVSPEELAHKRAEFIHKALAGVELKT